MGDKQAGANTGKVMKRSSVVNDGKPLVNNEKAATIAAKEQNLLKGWKQVGEHQLISLASHRGSDDECVCVCGVTETGCFLHKAPATLQVLSG